MEITDEIEELLRQFSDRMKVRMADPGYDPKAAKDPVLSALVVRIAEESKRLTPKQREEAMDAFFESLERRYN